MLDSFSKTLLDSAEKININLSDLQIYKLFDFYQTVLDYNKNVNLTSITDEKDFIVKHIIDSIYPVFLLNKNIKICDIGAGAGFPSIPLKILRNDLDFTLFDALQKRIDFLNYATQKLNLSNIKSFHLRAEEGGKNNFRNYFDAVCCRAVSNTSTLLEYAIPLLKKGGIFINYKGSDLSDVVNAETAEKLLCCKRINTLSFNLPFDYGKRNIIVYKKIKDTPDLYPRPTSIIKKSPL